MEDLDDFDGINQEQCILKPDRYWRSGGKIEQRRHMVSRPARQTEARKKANLVLNQEVSRALDRYFDDTYGPKDKFAYLLPMIA